MSSSLLSARLSLFYATTVNYHQLLCSPLLQPSTSSHPQHSFDVLDLTIFVNDPIFSSISKLIFYIQLLHCHWFLVRITKPASLHSYLSISMYPFPIRSWHHQFTMSSNHHHILPNLILSSSARPNLLAISPFFFLVQIQAILVSLFLLI